MLGSIVHAAEKPADVVVYGGTSGGVAAAVQAARMGHSVVLIEPGRHLGGLTSGGLGATDIGNKEAIGGVAREFYQRIYRHYAQARGVEAGDRSTSTATGRRRPVDADTMWAFEPHVAEEVFRQMLAEAGVPVVLGERLDLAAASARRARGSRPSSWSRAASFPAASSSTPPTKAT